MLVGLREASTTHISVSLRYRLFDEDGGMSPDAISDERNTCRYLPECLQSSVDVCCSPCFVDVIQQKCVWCI